MCHIGRLSLCHGPSFFLWSSTIQFTNQKRNSQRNCDWLGNKMLYLFKMYFFVVFFFNFPFLNFILRIFRNYIHLSTPFSQCYTLHFLFFSSWLTIDFSAPKKITNNKIFHYASFLNFLFLFKNYLNQFHFYSVLINLF